LRKGGANALRQGLGYQNKTLATLQLAQIVWVLLDIQAAAKATLRKYNVKAVRFNKALRELCVVSAISA